MTHLVTPKHPLAEVFGFPISNDSPEARRFRKNKLCPFNNKVPNCTKDKADEPLGVCSIFNGDGIAITCPIRFREAWLIAEDAVRFLFPPDTNWTSLTEIRLEDRHGKSAGNIDIVLVAYDRKGQILDFGSLEVQAVHRTVYTKFETALAEISTPSVGPIEEFVSKLQAKLDGKLENPPDTRTLLEDTLTP
ncbi:MAG: hypothetical protein KGZ35_00860 [Truepera sp.]|nr:hypothetical protein [Truepera sp.]